jgi:hypothetical protein
MRVVTRPDPFPGQIGESPLIAVLVGFALGYVASFWIHGGGRPGKVAEGRRTPERLSTGVATPDKKTGLQFLLRPQYPPQHLLPMKPSCIMMGRTLG